MRELMADGLAPRSVARAVACVRGLLSIPAVERTHATDPADDLRPPRAWPALPKFLSIEEVDRLLAQPDPATPRGLRDKALIELLYATGLRVSELVACVPDDVNLDAGYLTCIGKGDKQRIVPLGDEAVDWVRRYLARRRGRRCCGKRSRRGCSSTRATAAGCRASGFWKVLKDTASRRACRAI